MLSALILSTALLADTAVPTAPTSAAAASSRAAVSVDAYHRDYESPKDAQEQRFDANLRQAYVSKEIQVGNLEGSWMVVTPAGQKLVGLELRSEGAASGKLEGAWRSMLTNLGLNDSGFVTDVSLTGRDLEINYFANKARSPTILQLHKSDDGLWRGNMLDTVGHKTPIMLARVNTGD